MIAAIVRGGRSGSFRSSLAYVLHDRDGIGTERVGETQTVNLLSKAEQAHKEMQTTADAAKAIQARERIERGERAGASGSRAEKTCFHYALSWHPDDDPTREQMFKAAHQTLDRLGLSEHQAVIVQHTEKPHRHLHVVVSTIHPETGRANSLYKDAYVLSRWCHEYEKGQQMFRSFRRAAKYEQEKRPDQKPQWAAWKDKQRELWKARQKDMAALQTKHDQRKDQHEKRVNEVRRAAEIDKQNAQRRHRDQMNDYWHRQAPKPAMHLRPPASFTRPQMTAGGEMGSALKGLLKTTHATVPKVEERRRMEQNKGIARDMFGKAKASPHPLEKPSPEPPARSAIHGQFRDRAPNSYENKLRHAGIEDRHDGVQAIKRWQAGQINEIDRQARETIARLREEREIEIEAERDERQTLVDIHNLRKDEARRELGIPDMNREKDKPEPEINRDEYDNEIIDMSGPAQPERNPVDVESYVDDNSAGRGRARRKHQQFAANYGPEIDEEFHRRHEAELQGARYDAPPLEPDPPSYEPEPYTPSEPNQDREPDHDYEYGD